MNDVVTRPKPLQEEPFAEHKYMPVMLPRKPRPATISAPTPSPASPPGAPPVANVTSQFGICRFFSEQTIEIGEPFNPPNLSIDNGIAVYMDLRLAESEETPGKITLTLQEVVIPTADQQDIQTSFCFSGVYVRTTTIARDSIFWGSSTRRSSGPSFRVNPPVCNDIEYRSGTGITYVPTQWFQKPIEFHLEQNRFTANMFPFDRWKARPIDIYPLIELHDGKNTTNVPIVTNLRSTLPNWDETVDVQFDVLSQIDNQEQPVTRINLTLVRPITQRLLTATLGIFLKIIKDFEA
jgi:hypothetical protein